MISNDILLLKIINVNGSLSLLRKRGLTHSQIASLISSNCENGNITIDETGIVLSEKGTQLLKEALQANGINQKNKWIIPQEHNYSKPLSQRKIFLPKGKKFKI